MEVFHRIAGISFIIKWMIWTWSVILSQMISVFYNTIFCDSEFIQSTLNLCSETQNSQIAKM